LPIDTVKRARRVGFGKKSKPEQPPSRREAKEDRKRAEKDAKQDMHKEGVTGKKCSKGKHFPETKYKDDYHGTRQYYVTSCSECGCYLDDGYVKAP
jgi:hypothetical protein